ncbi:MAG TPA: GntR family transcriptional regulator [Firmicutes bacterium]|nr:GntR family transcriptional regulator [Bacillota bacterium]
MPLPRIGRGTTLTDQAYQAIKNAIIANHLPPNSFLLEEQLARELGLSRTPVRDALKRLAYERLVVVTPNKGAVVSEISAADMQKIAVIREALEPLAAGQAAERTREEELARLAEVLEGQGRAIEDGNYTNYLQFDCDFHRLVATATENELLADIITSLNTQVQRFLILARNLPEKAPLAVTEHTVVLHALAAHDSKAAEAAMREHLQKVHRRLFDTYAST